MNFPLVSIGVPVFNGGSFLDQSIKSLVEQNYHNVEIIISDNCSTDETQDICLKYASRYPNIRYYRQIKNIGMAPNFSFVLHKARGSYFCWSAADDIHSKDFIKFNLDFLESHPCYIGSISKTRYVNGNFDYILTGDQGIEDTDVEERFINFFQNWHSNARFFSLIRTKTMLEYPFIGIDFLGADWAYVLHLLKYGKFKRLTDGELLLGANGISKSSDFLKKYRFKKIELFIPFWELTYQVFIITNKFSTINRSLIIYKCIRLSFISLKNEILKYIHKFYLNKFK
jgi:glycosyltransferase involved in cell wall biosynthesis